MARLFIFADEAGDFNFSRQQRASRYFIVCTISMHACHIGDALVALRRDLAWRKMPIKDYFHAAEEKQPIRDEVFGVLRQHDFKIQATIMEKSKAQPQTRTSNARFYQYGWFYHLKHVAPQLVRPDTELLVTAASLGTKKGQAVFTGAVNDVVQQTIQRNQWATTFCSSATDPCLLVADYCTWAIQRKWELADERSYALIKDRITYEYDLWRRGARHYY